MQTYYIGEELKIQTETGNKVAIGRDGKMIISAESYNGVAVINIDDRFSAGTYSVVITNSAKFVSTEIISIKNPFANRSKKEQLREMIRDIDKVIEYRLTNNEDAVQTMSINGKSFTYETLDVLMQARSKFIRQLSDVIEAENLRKGKSPIINIKTKFTRPRC